MVSLSIISISRGSSEHGHVSVSPSLYSSHSRSHPNRNSNSKDIRNYTNTSLRNSSRERLLKPVRFENKHLKAGKAYKTRTMSSNGNEGTNKEARKSYGIGGAGNIRRPSEVLYAPRTNPDGTRRASVWSNLSSSPPEGRRASIMSFFRRGSVGGEDVSAADSGDSGKRKVGVE